MSMGRGGRGYVPRGGGVTRGGYGGRGGAVGAGGGLANPAMGGMMGGGMPMREFCCLAVDCERPAG
jgi:hypothetical protein